MANGQAGAVSRSDVNGLSWRVGKRGADNHMIKGLWRCIKLPFAIIFGIIMTLIIRFKK
jgi:hypothetical protein